jgi:tryptophan 2,3-dioxygenase
MPFFEEEYWRAYQPTQASGTPGQHVFWADYHTIYKQSLTEREQGKINDFESVFFEKAQAGGVEKDNSPSINGFSAAALRSALFIMLYRDFPVFQTSYQILDMLVEIDHALSNWRYKHFIMVRRMIGLRVGTGNTSGAGYLEGALGQHYIYKDIAGLSTYLVKRASLPKLPGELIKYLSFNMY